MMEGILSTSIVEKKNVCCRTVSTGHQDILICIDPAVITPITTWKFDFIHVRNL